MPLNTLDEERIIQAFQESWGQPVTESSSIGQFGVFMGVRLMNLEGSWSWARRSGASNKLNRWLRYRIRVTSGYNQPITRVSICGQTVELNETVPFTWHFTDTYPELALRIKQLFTIRPITQEDLTNNIHAVT